MFKFRTHLKTKSFKDLYWNGSVSIQFGFGMVRFLATPIYQNLPSKTEPEHKKYKMASKKVLTILKPNHSQTSFEPFKIQTCLVFESLLHSTITIIRGSNISVQKRPKARFTKLQTLLSQTSISTYQVKILLVNKIVIVNLGNGYNWDLSNGIVQYSNG